MPDKHLIQTYLNTYAEPESQRDWQFQRTWEAVLCVPVCGESADCIQGMLTQCNTKQVLVIAVVNRPLEHPLTLQWQQQNQTLISHQRSLAARVTALDDDIELLEYASGLSCVVVDRSGKHPIPSKNGVGQARKIAADVAVQLIHSGIVKQPWIFSTDADVQLPENYFEVVQAVNPTEVSAVCLPFEHKTDQQPWALQQHLYDFKLYYYQAGIRFAGAAYDYIPLGSTLVVSALAYAQVRGFPMRNGAEDFYILNKLAKLGRIEQPQQPLIDIESRLSERVPFGTGPAVRTLLDASDALQYPLYYHPQCFYHLKQWYVFLQDYWQQRQLPEDEVLMELIEFFNLQQVLNKTLPHIRTKKRWQQFVHEWLDAFRLLKSVHFLCERYPRINVQMLSQLPEFHQIDVDQQLRMRLQNMV